MSDREKNKQWSGLGCSHCSYEATKKLAQRSRGYCLECGRRMTPTTDGARNPFPKLKVTRIRRILTRLRFEPGQCIPDVGETWMARTAIGGQLVRVTLQEIHNTQPHPTEQGVTLMEARVRQAILATVPPGPTRPQRESETRP